MRQEFNDDPRLRWMIGCVRDLPRLRRAMNGVDLVIHAAALKRVEVGIYCPTETMRTNVDGSQNVIEAATDARVLKAVLVSSDKAFHPTNAYGVSKAMAEHLWLGAHHGSFGPKFGICRYGNVLGSTGSVVPLWRAATGPVELRAPEATRFMMTRQQAACLVLDTAETMRGGELAIPDLPAYRMADLAEAMGKDCRITSLMPGEKMHESMSEDKSSDRARRLSIAEIREALESV